MISVEITRDETSGDVARILCACGEKTYLKICSCVCKTQLSSPPIMPPPEPNIVYKTIYKTENKIEYITVEKQKEYPKKIHHPRIRSIWKGMKRRCYDEKDPAYPLYGGRGIDICDEWLDFENFLKWSLDNGYDYGLSIDRLDNYKGYSPENARWATRKQQMNNRRCSIFITAFGESKTASEWIDDPRCNVTAANTITRRIKDGLSPEEAITKSHWFRPVQ